MKTLVIAAVGLIMVACSGNLSDKQALFNNVSKYEVAQVVVERIVVDPDIDRDVKVRVFQANEVAFEAVTRYRAAVEAGLDTQALITQASVGVVNLVRLLLEFGLIDSNILAMNDTDNGYILAKGWGGIGDGGSVLIDIDRGFKTAWKPVIIGGGSANIGVATI
jgi:hypothetical protein